MTKEKLTKIFEDLGAANPEDWAESEVSEGIPQLARFLFLKGCWSNIVSDTEPSWIDEIISRIPEDSNELFAGTAHALRRLLASGANREDIAEVVRGMQAELLFHVCYQLADSDVVEGYDFVKWALMEVGEDEVPSREIAGLHRACPHGR